LNPHGGDDIIRQHFLGVLVDIMSSLEPDRRLLHYRVIDKIGQGGMGEVYKAEDTKLGRNVAIKLLPPSSSESLIARKRFLQEAQSASALSHPNIVTVHSIEELDELVFIVMEFVDGETLKTRLDHEGALQLNALVEIGIQVAEALHAAHSINLVHRDVKPANILITQRGHAKVTDFGLAKLFRTVANEPANEAPTLANLTDSGTVLGTAAYMSPEQTRGQQVDPRSDIFSLGSVLYEAATRSIPFNGPSMLSIMHAIATVEPAAPSKLRPELPREFDLIIERALAKDAERRYQSAQEMANSLQSLRASLTGSWAGVPIICDPGFSDTSAPLVVGREAELEKLGAALKQAIEGTGRLFFLTGGPGMGKTSLADEFLRRARRQYPALLMSRGRCVEQYGTGEAYLPFLDAMGAMLSGSGRERVGAVLRTHAPTWCLELPTAFATTTGSLEKLQQETIGATKERMMREMGDALGSLATTTPVVILLEDLHWGDPSSVDLLRHLSQRIANQRLLIIGTFRPEDIEVGNHPLKSYKAEMQAHKLCDEIALASLSRQHITEYLNAVFSPNNFPPELGALVHEKTEGHALFATNLLQYLAERGDIVKSNGRWSIARPLSEMNLEAPESVRSMISKKIDALAEEDRRTLQYCSVQGTEFLSTVAAALLGVDEIDLEERLAQLEKTHRLVETLDEEDMPDGSVATRYRFAHALFQNFLYGDLVNKRRIQLHKQAGDTLVQHYRKRANQIAAQLAIHFERGRDFPRAVEFLTHAGDNATKLFAFTEAESHYSQAINLIRRSFEDEPAETLMALYQKRGTVSHMMGSFAQAVKDFTSMLELAQELERLDQQSAALNAMTMSLFFSHLLEETEARAAEALQVAERAGSQTLRLDTMCLVAMKHLCYGELPQAKTVLDDIIATARELGYKPALMTGLTWRACLHFFQTEYEMAIKLVAESSKLAIELRDGFLLLTSLFFRGLSEGNLGSMSAGLSTLHAAIDKARNNGDRFWYPRMPNCIGWIHRELQDFEGALKYDQEGVEIAREHHVLEAEANSMINLGIDFSQAGDSNKTVAAFHTVHDIFARDAWFRWRYNIRLQAATAHHWLRQGDPSKARECTYGLLETAREHEVHKYIAVAYRFLSQAAWAEGNLAEAEAQINLALSELKQYPVPVVAWRVYADLAKLKSSAGDQAGARAAFAEAAAIVRSIAENVEDEALRSKFMSSSAVTQVLSGAPLAAQQGDSYA
jgi:serine/threonine protein kinase/tetratricopeptide (TPR) repeat protein